MARQQQDWVSLGWVFSYPLLAVLAAMIYLSAEEIAQPQRPKVAAAPVVIDSPDWSADFATRVETLNSRLQAAVEPLGAEVSSENQQGASSLRWTHRVVDVKAEPERRGEVEEALETLRVVDPGVSLVSEETFNGAQVLVGLDGLLTHTVRIFWSDQPVRPRVAVVVLALGDDLRFARDVIELEQPVAVAVLPFRPFSAQVAELAKMFECDVLLQWSEGEEAKGLDAALASVPGAIGVALQGDGASDDLSAEVRQRGLLAIAADGGAGGPSVTVLPIDQGTGPAFDSVTRRAQAGGRAVGLASGVGPAELEQLRSMLSKWNEEQIEIVKVSQLFGVVDQPPA